MPDAVAFQDENGVDDLDYYKKLSSLKNRNFNKNEVQFWFTAFETSLKHMGVKSQWSKREVLHSLLSDEVQVVVKHILKKDQANAGELPYKSLKLELLKKYAPKPEAAFERALSRTLTSTPSALLSSLIDDICKCDEPLSTKCCQLTVWGLWSRQLSTPIRQRLAGSKFTKDTYETLAELADALHVTNQTSSQVSAVKTTPAPSLDETQPAIPYSVNAANRGNGGRGRRPGRGQARGNRGGRGGGQNNQNGQNQNQGQNNSKWPTAKHEDVPKKGYFCFNHHTYGRGAFHCTDPLTCSWANIPPHPCPKPVTNN